MKAMFLSLLALALALSTGFSFAEGDKDKKKDEAKEVELKGTLACAKCTFKLDKKIHGGNCTNAIEVVEKKDGKESKVIYVIEDSGKDEKYHKCSGKVEGVKVKGTISKKKDTGDQQYVKPAKDGVELPKG